MTDFISSCCSAPDRETGEGGPTFSELEMCPKCRMRCCFLDADKLCETCGLESCDCHIENVGWIG